MTHEDLLKALRDTARFERSAPDAEAPAPDPERIEQWTDAALEALLGKPAVNQPTVVAISRAKRRSRFLVWSLPAVAAAAAILVFSRPQPSLPPYQSEWVEGFESTTRDATTSAGPLVFRSGKHFELLLRPPTQTDARPSIGVFLVHAEGFMKLDTRDEVGRLGTVRVKGNMPRALPGRGPWSLQVVLAAEEVSAPSDTIAASQRIRVEIVAPTP